MMSTAKEASALELGTRALGSRLRLPAETKRRGTRRARWVLGHVGGREEGGCGNQKGEDAADIGTPGTQKSGVKRVKVEIED